MADKELSGYLNETLSKNFQVSVYDDPEQICSFKGQRNPDAIIIDETVNGVYGSELCAEIKEDVCMCNIPVILLISSNDDYLMNTSCGADRIELRMVNVCKLKADIVALINHRIVQKERLKEFAASTLPGDHSEKVTQGDSDAILVDKIQKCLEKNLSTEKYTVEMLCADIGMSRTAFYNRVKLIAGQSPTNYILSYKMGIAKTMLASRQYSVTEISTLLGYCDSKYFSKKFKDFHGVSPMQYVRDAMG
ncbi:DNA-binding response regulator [Bacteroides fragilis]|uniref:response regulator transcription factor n=1 Tax=Bacteroides fragilis TaxID=817 RepID=UPI00203020D8|nr:DNA-binding response regulator [Bacteroides fragilis]MCM0238973.1 DNA-binding response regulator [Bacteroides fragilis]